MDGRCEVFALAVLNLSFPLLFHPDLAGVYHDAEYVTTLKKLAHVLLGSMMCLSSQATGLMLFIFVGDRVKGVSSQSSCRDQPKIPWNSLLIVAGKDVPGISCLPSQSDRQAP